MSDAYNLIAELVRDPEWAVALDFAGTDNTRYVRFDPQSNQFLALNKCGKFVGETHPISSETLLTTIDQHDTRHWVGREYMSHGVGSSNRSGGSQYAIDTHE